MDLIQFYLQMEQQLVTRCFVIVEVFLLMYLCRNKHRQMHPYRCVYAVHGCTDYVLYCVCMCVHMHIHACTHARVCVCMYVCCVFVCIHKMHIKCSIYNTYMYVYI